MRKLAIIGASGHGKVVADIARKNGYTEIVFLDDATTSGFCSTYPIVGNSDCIENLDVAIEKGLDVLLMDREDNIDCDKYKKINDLSSI